MRISTALTLMLVSFSACGSSAKTYDFTDNGCDTKEHSFDSIQAYCQGLTSTSLNQGCALGLRQDAFQRDCSGNFTATN
jgi:hypothetical protein